MASNDKSDRKMEVVHSQCAFPNQLCVIVTDIDKRGDRILLVGKNKCEIAHDGVHKHTEAMSFRVCSRALARSSPVMEAMLFGRFLEATQTTIHLPEDDPKAMSSLLHLAHGSIDQVYELSDSQTRDGSTDPHDSFVDDIYGLVILANKYLMSKKLRPFVSTWCGLLTAWDGYAMESDDMAPYCQRLEKSLWLASEFGHLPLYRSVLGHLSWYIELDYPLFEHVPEPDGVTDLIRIGRIRTIDDSLRPIRQAIHALTNNADPTGSYLCNRSVQKDRLSCQAHVLGHMIRDLNAENLWPLPEAEDVDEAAWTFVYNFEITLWEDYIPLHTGCCIVPKMKAYFAKISTSNLDERSMPPKAILNSMLSAAKALRAFPYEEMYMFTGADGVFD